MYFIGGRDKKLKKLRDERRAPVIKFDNTLRVFGLVKGT